jgi:hypothetical protein
MALNNPLGQFEKILKMVWYGMVMAVKEALDT